MKQKFILISVLIGLVALLALLNAATYVQKEKEPDSELYPNRSTYNTGSTGTQAFYTLLVETGRNVTRWQTSLDSIANQTSGRPSVLVMIGPLKRELTETEESALMRWVSMGGTLVLIDREPSHELVQSTTQWQISSIPAADPDLLNIDASDPRQMTLGTAAHKPVQPSRFSSGVNAVQPSRFASSVELKRYVDHSAVPRPLPTSEELYDLRTPTMPSPTPYDFYSNEPPPPPPPTNSSGYGSGTGSDSGSADESEYDDDVDADYAEAEEDTVTFAAPMVHIAGSGTNLVVDAPFAQGRVVILSDPYVVSNSGINLVDNARLAVNMVTASGGLIAFDEYHHGYGSNQNRLFNYFRDTPVVALFLQVGLLVALVFISQSSRFARAVPEKETSRLSKLEYVSAMAELQQRTKAYDLAIENIYSDFRRRVCALVGLDNTLAKAEEIAGRIAERIGGDAANIRSLMLTCEDAIHGEPIGRRETVDLVESLRRLESKLGLKRSTIGIPK